MTALGLVMVLSTVAYLVCGEIRRAARGEVAPPRQVSSLMPLVWLGAGVAVLFVPRVLGLLS